MDATRSYCRAYRRDQLEAFAGWPAAHAGTPAIDVLYLHDNFVVTRGVYRDEAIVFAAVTPEWISFCQDTLGFTLPALADGPALAAAPPPSAAADSPDAGVERSTP